MRRIVSRVNQNLSGSNKPSYGRILAEYPTEWDLAAAVDFALWAYSSEMKRKEKFERWKIDDDGFVARKGDSKASKDDVDDEAPFSKEEE